MSKNTTNLIKAFLSLNDTEKRQVINIIKALEENEPYQYKAIFESFGLDSVLGSTTVNFAPVPGRCSLCGK